MGLSRITDYLAQLFHGWADLAGGSLILIGIAALLLLMVVGRAARKLVGILAVLAVLIGAYMFFTDTPFSAVREFITGLFDTGLPG